jgi:hypothetical protein
MELALNIVWLLVAVGAFASVCVRVASETERRRIWLIGVATLCAVTLLLPIISITDDLHDSSAVLEEAWAVRRGVIAAAQHAVTANLPAVVVSCAIALTLLAFVSEETFAHPLLASRVVFALRGPPLAGC